MSQEVISFEELVSQLTKSGAEILSEMTVKDADLLHMGVGVCGEAGELIDAIKKSVIYRKPLDIENMTEELGDLEFYMERIRQIIGVTRQETLDYCTNKLLKRYKGMNYSNDAAQARVDKQIEDIESTGFESSNLATALQPTTQDGGMFISKEHIDLLHGLYQFTKFAAQPFRTPPDENGIQQTSQEWWREYYSRLETAQVSIKAILNI